MGWASGAGILEQVVRLIDPYLPKDKAVGVYVGLIRAFEDADCDTIDELEGLSRTFNMALKNCGYHIGSPLCDWEEPCACGWTY